MNIRYPIYEEVYRILTLKVNANSGQLQYFQENPDIRRNTARRAAQADDTQNRQQEQKKGSRQAV